MFHWWVEKARLSKYIDILPTGTAVSRSAMNLVKENREPSIILANNKALGILGETNLTEKPFQL
eukprot:scaffold22596_cov131-Cylindrotheca_fusiformis.AAC.22